MWRGRRRLRRLEGELFAARADQADLRRRLELFEQIAQSAGAAIGDVPAMPMPPELVAAAREGRARDFPVHLDILGTKAIAVIGADGDPREWWTAIWQFAAPEEPAS